MIKNVILIDDKNNLDFYPFNALHPIYELRIGALKNYQRIEKIFHDAKLNFMNNFEDIDNSDKSDKSFNSQQLKLASFLKRNNIDNNNENHTTKDIVLEKAFIINPRFIITKENYNDIIDIINLNPFKTILFKNGENLFGYYFDVFKISTIQEISFDSELDTIKESYKMSDHFIIVELNQTTTINYLWETLDLVKNSIINDFKYFESISLKDIKTQDGIFLMSKEKIKIGNNVKIEPMVVLNADDGEIIIDDNAKIMSNTVVYGPCYIGKNTVIKPGAKIYPNTSIGDYCKIGGEVENTIFQGYSNKQHEGFLGHSFISEWVNFGADTNNSDLKNTYTNISMQLPHKLVDSGRIFLGLMCGDHTKTGINSMFTTGTVSGLCGILVKEWFLPNFIKSFSWGGKHNSPLYKVDKAIETAKIVMKRRNRELLEEEIELLKIEYNRVINEK